MNIKNSLKQRFFRILGKTKKLQKEYVRRARTEIVSTWSRSRRWQLSRTHPTQKSKRVILSLCPSYPSVKRFFFEKETSVKFLSFSLFLNSKLKFWNFEFFSQRWECETWARFFFSSNLVSQIKTILMREGVEDEPYYFQSNQQLWIIVLYLLQ